MLSYSGDPSLRGRRGSRQNGTPSKLQTRWKMKEKPAKGVKGCLLYDPIDGGYFFRVYDEIDKTRFTDYTMCAEDISVVLDCSVLSLFEPDDGDNRLDWSTSYLGR